MGVLLCKAKKFKKKYVKFIILTFKVPGMFPELLKGSLEATNFQIVTAIVGQFTKGCLIKNWSIFFHHTKNDGRITGIGIFPKSRNK